MGWQLEEKDRMGFEAYTHGDRAVGVQGVIMSGIPMNPRLYQRLSDEVIAAFD